MNIDEPGATSPVASLRQCFRDPIPEIQVVSELLKSAVNAHHQGKPDLVEALIKQANMPVIREWTDSI